MRHTGGCLPLTHGWIICAICWITRIMEEPFLGKLNSKCPRYRILENTEKYLDLKRKRRNSLKEYSPMYIIFYKRTEGINKPHLAQYHNSSRIYNIGNCIYVTRRYCQSKYKAWYENISYNLLNSDCKLEDFTKLTC